MAPRIDLRLVEIATMAALLTACSGTPGASSSTSNTAAGAGQPSAAASDTTRASAPPVIAGDTRVRSARERAARGDLPGAATALRALVDDGSLDARVRGEARLALVELWLAHEDVTETVPSCVPAPAPRANDAPARTFPVSPRLEARRAARVELGCAQTAGLDVGAARDRIEAQAQREAALCAARGEQPAEGRTLLLLGTARQVDPCEGPVADVFGPTPLSPIDRRLGVRPPPGPSLEDALRGASDVGVAR